MKILILSYEFPPVGGGGGRIAADVGSRLAERGHEIAAITSHVKGLARRERLSSVEVHRIRTGRRRLDRCSVPEMAGFVAAGAVHALRFARKWRPDVMHVHFAVPTGAAAWVASKLAGVPYVLTAHLGDVPGAPGQSTEYLFRFLKPLTVPILRRAASVTAVSPFVAELCEKAYGITPRVILNGIDRADYPRRASHPSSPVRIVWVGRMHPQKNLIAGLEVLGCLRDLHWTLDVVGDGPERDRTEEAARAAGLSGHVAFRGWRPEREVRDFIASADILYLPSLSEGLPLVALQALASGLAIVCSRVGGLEGVVEDGNNGYRCSLDRSQAFAEALRELIENPFLLRKMQQASAEIASKFSLDSIVDDYEDVLLRAAGEGPAPAAARGEETLG